MTEPTLRQKLDGVLTDYLVGDRQEDPPGILSVTLSIQEIQSLAEMLREDEPPDTMGVNPGLYRVTFVALGASSLRSVTGEGIHNRHDVPVFERESDAESMCRCLGLAYRAGQRQRSRSLMRLLSGEL